MSEAGSGGAGSGVRLLGMVLFLATGFPYAFSGLLAPPWGVGVLWAAWIVFLVLLIRSWRRGPWIVLAIPFAAMAVWAAVMYLGDVLLDWTA